MLAKMPRFVKSGSAGGMRKNTDARPSPGGEGRSAPDRRDVSQQPLECPRCHCQAETLGSGWQSRSCPSCGAPLVLASGPVETLVRNYLYRDRLEKRRSARY